MHAQTTNQEFMRLFPFKAKLSLEPLYEHLKKSLDRLDRGWPHPGKAVLKAFEATSELRGGISDPSVVEKHPKLMARMMSAVFSSVQWETEPTGALTPFGLVPFFVSPKYKSLFLDASGAINSQRTRKEAIESRAVKAYLGILREFYGIEKELEKPVIYSALDEATGLPRLYRLRMELNFIKVRALGKLPELGPGRREEILDNLDNPMALKNILPPELFEFAGFSVVRSEEVTIPDTISALSWDLIDQRSVVSSEGFFRLQERLRTLFRRPGLIASLAAVRGDQVYMLNMGCDLEKSCLFAGTRHVPKEIFRGTPYERVEEGEIIRIADIRKEPSFSSYMAKGDFKGMRSMLIAPLVFQGEVIGSFELASPEPGDLGPMEAVILDQIRPLFAMTIKKALDDVENNIQSVIKEEATAIHPSVEWRFRQAALNLMERRLAGHDGEIESIIFKRVYPLYGSSDVRGSSEARAQAVRSDLTEHLHLGLKVLEAAARERPLPMLNELSAACLEHLERMESRENLASGDELAVAEFMRDRVEGVFGHLRGLEGGTAPALERYRAGVDPATGGVYRRRKQFERSMDALNERLASYLDREAEVIQKACPHYFERHRTDGVDYIIYAGDSILKDGGFDAFILENLRLWQLITACGLAWHTEELKKELSMKLETAHLVMVHNSQLAIRFRFDEKRFDVDGAYDVRHEIIRSRLDKAVLAKNGERLTQPGLLSVVYTHVDEAQETRRHLEFMRREGLIRPGVEDLDLEDLSGVHGLKALRVEINLGSEALAQRAAQHLG